MTPQTPIEVLSGQALDALRQGQPAKARALLEQALRLDDSHPAVRHNLAELLARSGELAEAERLFQALLRDQPHFLPAYRSYLRLLEQRQRAGAASSQGSDQGAPADDPRSVVLNNFGNALQAAGQLPESETAYRQALQLAPDYPHPWSNLANVLRLQGRLSEAEQAARRALALRQDHAGAWVNLGCALTEMLCEAEAATCFERGLELTPANAEARHALGSGQLLNLLSRDDLSEAEVLARHRAWGEALVAGIPPRPLPPVRAGTPRLAFLSSDLRRHAVTLFLEPLLEHCDRQRFELVCYASQPQPGDAVAQRLRALPLTWTPCLTLSDAALADRIAADGIDLLIDLNGHTRGMRLAALASHPARRQASWLGYPFLTGLPSLDYRLTDGWVDPEGEIATDEMIATHEESGPERPMRLDRCQFVFRPQEGMPEVSPLPALSSGRITFGSLNNLQKLNPAVVALWSRLLLQVEGSQLLLQYSQATDPYWRGRVHGLFAASGVPPERLKLRPYVAGNTHLSSYHAIDIALDPFPYNGLTTTCEALWMGVPVVSLRGASRQGRGGTSLLQALGRPDWIAADGESYVAIGRKLAADPVALAAERLALRERMRLSPLRQEQEHARSFERCVDQILALPPSGLVG
ncbi:glycosyltransferase family 41 protein [Synechococcus sp. CS-1328]|uniref:O-linked N-acetylglucosamine transferase, SPINDLY family protein n=1 Tax=Synechococcus sp. CS-1328 TaxID=2847976 RepID=UPI00223C3B15|nr:glycosyltransferase family 41 protein [Synechococcus sp. CS-1328]MCT0223679.1 tetratricopeptide repeat protein [Synechococcus sp. CS-1328]